MRKFILGVFCTTLFWGIHTVQGQNSSYIGIYKEPTLSKYLIIKPLNDGYDLYFTTKDSGVLGNYKVKGDTLCLYPKFKYLGSKIWKIAPDDVSITDIPVFFIKKGDKLIDITEYEKYPNIAPWFKNGDVYNFERLRWGK